MQSPLDIAAHYLKSGQLEAAEAACREALKGLPGHPMAFGMLAVIGNARQDFRFALDHATTAVAAADSVAWLHVELAAALLGLGRLAKAATAARRAVEIDPDVPRGYPLLSRALMPGESYRDVITRFHALLTPKAYVEIGVATGATLALARPPCMAVGIDPKPSLQGGIATSVKLFPLESDTYFASRDLRTDLEAPSFDLAFIDGLHVFQQVLRDFINVERFAAPHSVVLIHDCIPIDPFTATPERRSSFWTGDVWKVMAALLKWRPDLDVQSVATPPSGLGVVCRLDPKNRVLADNFDAIVAEFKDATPPVAPKDLRRLLAMVDNDWSRIAARVGRVTGTGVGGGTVVPSAGSA